MNHDKSEVDEEAGESPGNSGTAIELARSSRADFTTSAPISTGSSSEISEASPDQSSTNKELRRLNRALRALSACNQALAQAGSEQELLDQICDIIVRVGGYRIAGISYAE